MVALRLATATAVPSVAVATAEYVPAEAVPAPMMMVPVLPLPGDWMLMVAPAGNPITESVTLQVLPVRVSVAVMVSLAAPGKTSGAEFESDTERIPRLLPAPLLAEPPQAEKLATPNDNVAKHSILKVMSNQILDESRAARCDAGTSALFSSGETRSAVDYEIESAPVTESARKPGLGRAEFSPAKR